MIYYYEYFGGGFISFLRIIRAALFSAYSGQKSAFVDLTPLMVISAQLLVYFYMMSASH